MSTPIAIVYVTPTSDPRPVLGATQPVSADLELACELDGVIRQDRVTKKLLVGSRVDIIFLLPTWSRYRPVGVEFRHNLGSGDGDGNHNFPKTDRDYYPCYAKISCHWRARNMGWKFSIYMLDQSRNSFVIDPEIENTDLPPILAPKS